MSVICFYFYDIIVIIFFSCAVVISNFIKFEITVKHEKKGNYYYIIKIEAYR